MKRKKELCEVIQTKGGELVSMVSVKSRSGWTLEEEKGLIQLLLAIIPNE